MKKSMVGQSIVYPDEQLHNESIALVLIDEVARAINSSMYYRVQCAPCCWYDCGLSSDGVLCVDQTNSADFSLSLYPVIATCDLAIDGYSLWICRSIKRYSSCDNGVINLIQTTLTYT